MKIRVNSWFLSSLIRRQSKRRDLANRATFITLLKKPFPLLKLQFTAILIGMLVVTMRAGRAENLFDAGRLLDEPWMIATLWDAYCGFVTFYVWVAYKETAWWSRLLWFVLIMTLGNIAMAVYVLMQLFRLPADATMRDLLLRKSEAR